MENEIIENNALFYEDTSRIPWYDINKTTDSPIVFDETINRPLEPKNQPLHAESKENNIDDSVIFVSETDAKADFISLSLFESTSTERSAKVTPQSNKRAVKRNMRKKRKKLNSAKLTCNKSAFKNILNDLKPLEQNSSEIIILDDTLKSPQEQQEPQIQAVSDTNNIDDSVIFVSETNSPTLKIKKLLRSSRKINKSPAKSKQNIRKLIRKTERKFRQTLKYTHQCNELLRSPAKNGMEILGVQNSNEQCDIINLDNIEETVNIAQKRMVLLDGSNIAFKHSNDKFFSVEGLKICLEYFEKRGYDVKAVVPQFRFKRSKTNNSTLLENLKNVGKIIVTPSKQLPGNFSCSYDDRCIIQMAYEMDAAIVSNDNYCDLINENADFKKIIESRVIGYYWCKDLFMLPQDPYGRNGPTLNEILLR